MGNIHDQIMEKVTLHHLLHHAPLFMHAVLCHRTHRSGSWLKELRLEAAGEE